MRILSCLVVFGLLSVVVAPLTPVAHADDPQRAMELFQAGTRYFDLGQFDKAIDAWQSGYREKADPVFLYNIAQAYRLAGDLNKAIFFYRGYLRNSPKAHNRPEVEQRIAGLQKQLADQEQDKAAQRSRPAGHEHDKDEKDDKAGSRAAGAAPRSTPAPVTIAGAASVPVPGGTLSPASPSPPPAITEPPGSTWPTAPSTAVVAPGPEPGPVEAARRLDFGVGIGVDGWSSGVQGSANPSFALLLAGGYVLGRDAGAAVRFRLGGSLGYTFLKEDRSRETFLSLLVVPTLLVRAGARLGFFGELGVGVLGISGLAASSALLDHSVMLQINGTQGLLEIRPALGLQIQLTPAMGLFAATAVDYSPKGTHFYRPISRTELLVGMTLHR